MTTKTLHLSPASALVFLFGGADGVYVRVAGYEVGPVPKGASDTATAEALAFAVNDHADACVFVAASASGPVVTLTSKQEGADGNGVSLDAEATVAGAALVSGPTLSGGVSALFTY